MAISFNGNVTINGNVEIYDNGSMKISGNTYNVDVSELEDFIENTLPNSINKEEYKEAARTLNKPLQDESVVKQAIQKLIGFTKESGKAIWIVGLTGIAKAVAEAISKAI